MKSHCCAPSCHSFTTARFRTLPSAFSSVRWTTEKRFDVFQIRHFIFAPPAFASASAWMLAGAGGREEWRARARG